MTNVHQKKIVIIGGGFAGTNCAIKLERYFEVTLIDNKEYFEFTPSVLRALIEPDHLSKIQVMHKEYLKNANIVFGEVKSISNDSVNVNSISYPYNYLIICSGSKYRAPIKEKNIAILDRTKEIRMHSLQLSRAKSVLVIGGGTVGVELTAEIISNFPEKKVILVHSKEMLMERSNRRAQEYAKAYLLKKGVDVILGEKVVNVKKPTKNVYHTDKGRTINVDMAFLCTGVTPNFELLKAHFPSSLNSRNCLCVNNSLLVKGQKNIFAAGDICNVTEEKTAQNAEKQAGIVVKNIFHLEKNKKLENYASKSRIMVISLGNKDGILTYRHWACTGRFPAILKGFIEWKSMWKYKHR